MTTPTAPPAPPAPEPAEHVSLLAPASQMPPTAPLLVHPPPPSLVPAPPKVPPHPEQRYEFTNDRYFGTTAALEPVPVTPAAPRPEGDPNQCGGCNPPAKPYVYRQPQSAPMDRTFVYKPGPERTDVAAQLGFDDDARGSLGTTAQLLARGPQNYVLDINPQLTFFKPEYKRHTPFGAECVETDVALKLGATTTLTVPRRGDMLGDMIFEIQLPSLGIAGGRWADAIAYVLMERVKVSVDETTIHDHERLWYDLVDKLFMPQGRRQAVDAMIGRGVALATDAAHTVYLPLKFAWCKGHHANQQYLPLASLATKSQLTLEFTAADLARCLVLPDGASPPAVSHLAAKLLTDQIAVDDDERRAALQRPARMLVETVQDVDALSYGFDDEGTFAKNAVTLDLSEVNLPVKAIAFVAYDESAAQNSRFFEYLDCVDTALVQINSSDRFSARTGDYFSLVQTYGHAGRCTADRVHLYSFALEAHERQPSGALNCAVLDRPLLRLGLKNSAGRAIKLKAFALCLNWLALEGGSIGYMFQT
jgi:hypothetical protein